MEREGADYTGLREGVSGDRRHSRCRITLRWSRRHTSPDVRARVLTPQNTETQVRKLRIMDASHGELCHWALAGLTIPDWKLCAPRTDRLTILPGHHSAELGDVTKVVGDPRSQELPQRHLRKLGMLTFNGKLVPCSAIASSTPASPSAPPCIQRQTRVQ